MNDKLTMSGTRLPKTKFSMKKMYLLSVMVNVSKGFRVIPTYETTIIY